MPGADRTGPVGQGPMTGRAEGFCARSAVSRGLGYWGGRGFRGGFGRRCGLGRGRGALGGSGGSVPTVLSPEGRALELKEQEKMLRTALENIRREIEAMDAGKDPA